MGISPWIMNFTLLAHWITLVSQFWGRSINRIYFQVSSPLLRNVRFRYQEDEILANSLTSTNFHTYYQGSELVVAGRLPVTNVQSDSPALPNDLIKYEILATQATGSYLIDGQHNTSSKVCYFVLTTTIIWYTHTVLQYTHLITYLLHPRTIIFTYCKVLNTVPFRIAGRKSR